MKWKIYFVIAAFIIALLGSSCGIVLDIITSDNASLRIVNMTPYDIDYVSWKDYDGNLYYFGADMVWDEVEQSSVQGIASGHSDTQMVGSGESPVYFYFSTDSIKFRTVEDVEVDSWDNVNFTLEGDTPMSLVLSGVSPDGSRVSYNIIPIEGSRATETLK